MNVNNHNLIERTLDEINAFKQKREEAVRQGGGILKQNVKTLRQIWALRGIATRLRRIKELLQVEKYDLAFIGKDGTGKTTAICHLFNLL